MGIGRAVLRRRGGGERGQTTLEVVLLIALTVLVLIPAILEAQRALGRFHRDVTETVALPIP